MPLFFFECACGKQSKRLLKKAEDVQDCECGAKPTRTPQPMTSRVVEVLDNGIMSRRLERPADAERLFRERTKIKPDRGE